MVKVDAVVYGGKPEPVRNITFPVKALVGLTVITPSEELALGVAVGLGVGVGGGQY